MDVDDFPHLQRRFIEAWSVWTPENSGVPALPPAQKQLPSDEHQLTEDERRENLKMFSEMMKGWADKFSMEAEQRREQERLERQKELEKRRARKQEFDAQVEALLKQRAQQPEKTA
jgi:hypothetical protein